MGGVGCGGWGEVGGVGVGWGGFGLVGGCGVWVVEYCCGL